MERSIRRSDKAAEKTTHRAVTDKQNHIKKSCLVSLHKSSIGSSRAAGLLI